MVYTQSELITFSSHVFAIALNSLRSYLEQLLVFNELKMINLECKILIMVWHMFI